MPNATITVTAIAAAAAAAMVALALLRRRRFVIGQTRPVRAARDGRLYRVHPDHPDPEGAADRLAAVNTRLTRLMRALKRKYEIDVTIGEPKALSPFSAHYPRRCRAVANLLRRYNPDNLAENSPLDPSRDTSYVVGKGDLMAICLRQRPTGKSKGEPSAAGFVDTELACFVALHELTHIAVNVRQHPPEFWMCFAWLLREAQEAGIIGNVDYDVRPRSYCGLKVDYVPTKDPNVIAHPYI